jgi:hypothetical protein
LLKLPNPGSTHQIHPTAIAAITKSSLSQWQGNQAAASKRKPQRKREKMRGSYPKKIHD